MVPAYLNQLIPVSDLPGHRCLRSSSTLELLFPHTTIKTVAHILLQAFAQKEARGLVHKLFAFSAHFSILNSNFNKNRFNIL